MTSQLDGPDTPILVVSCSLNPTSRSHRLALVAEAVLRGLGVTHELIDLREWELPLCDGSNSYSHPLVRSLADKVAGAAAVLLVSPVYNYDLNAAVKNLVELTGQAWVEKPVGFLCSAGGRSSYMSPIGLANSLMLDFRSHIIPRFVYVTKEDFASNGEPSKESQARIRQLVEATIDMAMALAWVRKKS